ncbi:hypothetical protein DWY25_12895 [Holdemania filiformis]|mgnify:FL=1|uniref:Uncharacterized protein n=1 Tax=Holdemania filiformis TaxID=61171 RepID=A0A412FUM3_9FIRM|nr:hypothetical protein DWY25_12895 [Holdemania filiformis]
MVITNEFIITCIYIAPVLLISSNILSFLKKRNYILKLLYYFILLALILIILFLTCIWIVASFKIST